MAAYLIDTHLMLWWMTDDPQLGTATAARIADAELDIAVSVVSLWELRLKARRGKLRLPDTPLAATFAEQGIAVLPLKSEHVEAGRSVHLPHRDPFDHMLVAVAQTERRIFLTRDHHILAAQLPYVLAA